MSTAWARFGECNHCGWCCTVASQTLVTVQFGPTSDVEYYRTRGFALDHREGVPVAGRVMADVLIPCPQHAEYRCRIYDDRPTTCRAFPISPKQIVRSPCSYWFERVRDDGTVERLGGLGSPHAAEVAWAESSA